MKMLYSFAKDAIYTRLSRSLHVLILVRCTQLNGKKKNPWICEWMRFKILIQIRGLALLLLNLFRKCGRITFSFKNLLISDAGTADSLIRFHPDSNYTWHSSRRRVIVSEGAAALESGTGSSDPVSAGDAQVTVRSGRCQLRGRMTRTHYLIQFLRSIISPPSVSCLQFGIKWHSCLTV